MTVDPSWIEELSGFLRIPSVSADPAHAGDVVAAAEWLASFVRSAGGEASLVETAGPHPLVVGEIPASTGPEAPTVLVYGHFDVQPPGELELWDSPPFEPEIRGEWLYGRGTADDKGNLYLVLKAAELLAAAGALPVNVRVACDGEEEVGGDSIVQFLAADARGADACIIFDGNMPRRDTPAFMVATRGVNYYHLRLPNRGARPPQRRLRRRGAERAPRAAAGAGRGRPDAARAPGRSRRSDTRGARCLAASSTRAADVLAEQGARPMDAEAPEEFYLRTFARAAVDVNGIRGGEATLQKTVLPVAAEANVSIRLAPGQDAGAIDASLPAAPSRCRPPGAELGDRALGGRTPRASSTRPPRPSASGSTRSSGSSASAHCSCEPAARSRSCRPSP